MDLKSIKHDKGEICFVVSLCDILNYHGYQYSESFTSGIGSLLEYYYHRKNNWDNVYFRTTRYPSNFFEKFSSVMGFTLNKNQGKTLEESISNIKNILDEGTPLIMGPLDMYYLKYCRHDEHFRGHYVSIFKYNKNKFIGFDNEHKKPVEISKEELEKAWDVRFIESGPYSYFYLEIDDNVDERTKVKGGLLTAADNFLYPENECYGYNALIKLGSELPVWPGKIPEENFRKNEKWFSFMLKNKKVHMFPDFIKQASELLNISELSSAADLFTETDNKWYDLINLLEDKEESSEIQEAILYGKMGLRILNIAGMERKGMERIIECISKSKEDR